MALVRLQGTKGYSDTLISNILLYGHTWIMYKQGEDCESKLNYICDRLVQNEFGLGNLVFCC